MFDLEYPLIGIIYRCLRVQGGSWYPFYAPAVMSSSVHEISAAAQTGAKQDPKPETAETLDLKPTKP